MIISNILHWPIAQSAFIENNLNGMLYNPMFITHYCDVWLSYYIKFILKYNIGTTDRFKINCLEHKKSSLTINDNWDELLYKYFTQYNVDYNNNNIHLDKLKNLFNKEYEQHIKQLYYLYNERNILKSIYYRHHNSNKTRNCDISFLISSIRNNSECYIENIIEKIYSFGLDSYEIIIFCNKHYYRGKNIICLQEQDFGASWGFNRCYSVSSGFHIFALTDCCIPDVSVLDFINSGLVISAPINRC